jgi:phosphatidylserine/phosphatidylglycerophosphate/cardiolipin synthase-like enzyme
MNKVLERQIATTGSPIVPIDFLQSIFIAELIHPSRRLWISSPWISDIELIDNRARQFGTLCPDWPATRIRLSRVFETILERGGNLVIIVNDAAHNDEFMSRMQPLERFYNSQVRLVRSSLLHEKGILGDWFSLAGSMNLTYRGVYINQEYLIYTCDSSRVAERRIAFENRWGTEL